MKYSIQWGDVIVVNGSFIIMTTASNNLMTGKNQEEMWYVSISLIRYDSEA